MTKNISTKLGDAFQYWKPAPALDFSARNVCCQPKHKAKVNTEKEEKSKEKRREEGEIYWRCKISKLYETWFSVLYTYMHMFGFFTLLFLWKKRV